MTAKGEKRRDEEEGERSKLLLRYYGGSFLTCAVLGRLLAVRATCVHPEFVLIVHCGGWHNFPFPLFIQTLRYSQRSNFLFDSLCILNTLWFFLRIFGLASPSFKTWKRRPWLLGKALVQALERGNLPASLSYGPATGGQRIIACVHLQR